eukprot:m.184826 g.184826  ORF g.184826 m.184826 type:complete len:862 (-) comp32208_c0_seq2:233-2818(-)
MLSDQTVHTIRQALRAVLAGNVKARAVLYGTIGFVVALVVLMLPKLMVLVAIALTAMATYGIHTPVVSRSFVRPLSIAVFEHFNKKRYATYNSTMLDEASFASSETNLMLQKITEMLVKDYVHSWYDEYSKDDEVPKLSEEYLQHIIELLAARAFHIDRYKIVTQCIDRFRLHVQCFNTARLSSGGSGVCGFGQSTEELICYFERLPAAHEALKTDERLKCYLIEAAGVLIKTILPPHEHESDLLLQTFSRLCVHNVLLPALDVISEPDFLCQFLVTILSKPSNHNEETDDDIADNLGVATDDDEGLSDSDADDIGSFKSLAAVMMDSDLSTSRSPSDNNTDDCCGFLQKSPPFPTDTLSQTPANQVEEVLMVSQWRTLWVALIDDDLSFFNDPQHTRFEGEQMLSECLGISERVFIDDHIFLFALKYHDHDRYFAANSEDTLRKWVDKLKILINWNWVESNENIDTMSQQDNHHGIPQYSATITKAMNIQQHAEYCVHMKLDAGSNHTFVSGMLTSWMVNRRFREFKRLHKLLTASFGRAMQHVTFPGTMGAFGQKGLDSSILATRRALLDNYLQQLLEHRQIGSSTEVYQFLSSNNSALFPDQRLSNNKNVVSRALIRVNREVFAMAETLGTTLRGKRQGWAGCDMIFVRKQVPKDGFSSLDDTKSPFRKFLMKMTQTQSTTPSQPQQSTSTQAALSATTTTTTTVSTHPRPPREVPELIVSIVIEFAGLNTWWLGHPVFRRLVLSLGDGALTRLFEKEIDQMFSEENWLLYTHELVNVIWGNVAPPVLSEMEKADVKRKAFELILELVPKQLQEILRGDEATLEQAVICFLGSLNIQKLNKHIILNILDIILSQFVHM